MEADMSEWNVKATIDTRREETPDVHVLGVVVTLCPEEGGRPLTIHLSEVKLKDFRGCHPSVVLPYTVMFIDGLDEAIRTAILEEVENSINWNIPEDDVVNEARARMKGLLDFLAANGQSLGFDEDNDTLFIAPKGLQWDNQGKGGNALVPVTGEELEYRSEHCDICSEKICFCHPYDGSESLEKNGLRKAR
jgi:hypothetical protein